MGPGPELAGSCVTGAGAGDDDCHPDTILTLSHSAQFLTRTSAIKD